MQALAPWELAYEPALHAGQKSTPRASLALPAEHKVHVVGPVLENAVFCKKNGKTMKCTKEADSRTTLYDPTPQLAQTLKPVPLLNKPASQSSQTTYKKSKQPWQPTPATEESENSTRPGP